MTQIQKSIASFVAKGKPVAKENNFRPNVRVEVISAKVAGIDDNNGVKNVKFSVEGQKYQHSGFIGGNEVAFDLIQKAQEKDVPIIVRLERKRKKNVDIHKDIMELTKDMNTAKDNAVKTTVGVYDINNKQWILTSEAESEPSEDPDSVGSGIRSVNYNPNEFFAQPSQSSNAMPATNTNREHNSQVDNMITLYFFLKEKANDLGIDVNDEQLKEYTKVLVTACDFVQTKVFNMQAPVYSAYSYTRTRFLLFNFEEHDVNLTTDAFKSVDGIKAWARQFIRVGGQLWEWAMNETSQN